MPVIGVVADDLTGATTCAVLLARSGTKTVVLTELGHPEAVQYAAEKKAVVISTNSRPLPPKTAYEAAASATATLSGLGVSQFSKRIDTTFRGSIGAEVDAMLDQLGPETVAVVVPAMPQSRRFLSGGYSIIDGVPLEQTSAASDVRTPVRESHIPSLLSKQTSRKVGLVELKYVLSGGEQLTQRMCQLRAGGCTILVADTVTESDIRQIASACVTLNWRILAVDPGPFTAKLAFCRGIVGPEQPVPPLHPTAAQGGCVLIAAGSASLVTRRQLALFCRQAGNLCIHVDPRRLIGDETSFCGEVASVVRSASAYLASPSPPYALVFATADSGSLISLDEEDAQRGYAPGTCAQRINLGLGKVIKALMDAYPDVIDGLYCTGGDTQAAVCHALGVYCLEAVDYLIPQTDITRLTGPYSGIPMIGKGGLTGDDNIVSRIAERLRQETSYSR